ncbi:Yip1-domain-containing protein [Neoconidiobolus thromboides FSU 785]|nr:Yip1-domain-containing protein [Neoconidiobolus thromboides FSU 785]
MGSKGEYSAVVEVDDDLMDAPELEFQDFSALSQENAIPGNSTVTDQQYNRNFNSGFNPDSVPQSGTSATNKWLSIDSYAQYFDVDTEEVIQRIKQVFLIKTGGDRFLENISIKPDLYGPFWISTLVACTMFAVSSLMTSIGAFFLEIDFVYDFNMIWTSLFSVYFYTFLIPTLFYFTANYFNARPVLLDLITVYGYSMIIWVPAAILCGINYPWVRWLTVIAFSVYSGYFLAVNIYPVFKRSESAGMRSGLLMLAILIHIGFSIFIKFTYFAYEYNLTSPKVNKVPSGDGSS